MTDINRRLYSKTELNYAKPSGMDHKDALRAAFKNTWWVWILYASILSILFVPLSMMAQSLMALWAVPLLTAMMALTNVKAYYESYRKPLLYSDLEVHYNELGEFLKEKGYFDTKQEN